MNSHATWKEMAIELASTLGEAIPNAARSGNAAFFESGGDAERAIALIAEVLRRDLRDRTTVKPKENMK